MEYIEHPIEVESKAQIVNNLETALKCVIAYTTEESLPARDHIISAMYDAVCFLK